jgi:transposase-like protein
MSDTVSLDTGLTEQQEVAALLLASGAKAVDVADELGIDESTVSRWRRKAAFIARIKAHQADAQAEIMARMGDLVHEALDVVESLLTYPHDKSLQLRAAGLILSAAGVSRMSRASATAQAGVDDVVG